MRLSWGVFRRMCRVWSVECFIRWGSQMRTKWRQLFEAFGDGHSVHKRPVGLKVSGLGYDYSAVRQLLSAYQRVSSFVLYLYAIHKHQQYIFNPSVYFSSFSTVLSKLLKIVFVLLIPLIAFSSGPCPGCHVACAKSIILTAANLGKSSSSSSSSSVGW
jgi:hypothetical protein